jgi:hypothetical protein
MKNDALFMCAIFRVRSRSEKRNTPARRRRERRPSDPGQVRYPPNQVFDPFEVSDFEGSAGKNKTTELSIGRPDGEGLPLREDDHQWASAPEFDNPLNNLDSVIPKTGVTDSRDPRDPFSSAFVQILSSGSPGLDQLTT